MRIDGLLARLEHVRKNGTGWQTRCPAHDDRDPSLSIHEKGEKILVRCFAGCTAEEITAALGLTLADLFTERLTTLPPRQIAATYDYTDEAGTLLFQVVRFTPKTFRQRRPDSTAPDGWTWNLKDTRRVLYRLPDVLTADRVHVTEGEKDADALTTLGLVATTNPGGVGKWRPEYSDTLKDRAVMIWPDADAPGMAHAGQVASALDRVARSVKVVPVPGECKDLSDWLNQRDAQEPDTLRVELDRLAAEAPEWTSCTPSDSFLPLKEGVREERNFNPLSAADLLAQEDPPIDWLWRPMIPTGSLCLFAAFMKVGKSELAYHLLVALAQGRTFLGLPTRRTGILLLAVEEHPRDVKKRLRRVGLAADDSLYVHAAPLANTPETIKALEAFVTAQQIELICLDTLTRFWGVENENDNAEVVREVSPLLDLARRSGAAVLLIHHDRKSGGEDGRNIRGAGALFGLVDQAFLLERRPGTSDTQRSLKILGRYADSPKELVIDLQDGQYLNLGRPDEVGIKAARVKIWDALSLDPKDLETLAADAEVKERDTRKVIDELLTAGQIERSGEGKRGSPYLYSKSHEEGSDSFLPNTSLYREETIFEGL